MGDERMGTGDVVDPAGLILTVNYVVMGAETMQVTLATGPARCGPRSSPRTSRSAWPCSA